MMKKIRPTLKSCSHQYSEAKEGDVNDRLSQLPLDILLLIMSYLTMKDSARTSVLSRRWKHVWKYLPALLFKGDSSAMEKVEDYSQLVPLISGFTRWVNSVMEAYQGSSIAELRVIFDLDVNFESDIDKWVGFALSKQVKSLELNFTPVNRTISLNDCYTWPLESRLSSLGLHRNLASLRSLSLKYVKLNVEDIKCILLSCHKLENLCIVRGSVYLTQIKLPHVPLHLKHLEVARLPDLVCIDILAPKLLRGRPIALTIRDAYLLSEVSIGHGKYQGEVVANAYGSLSKYFPQLKNLSWDLLFNPAGGANHIKWNLGINNPPAMTNLKHLEIHVTSRCDGSLLGWASLIEASPVLQKLTVKFLGRFRQYGKINRKIKVKGEVKPLRNLKTLELVNFIGLPIELEFAMFVIQNCVCLKEVIYVLSPKSRMYVPRKFLESSRNFFKEFRSTLPPGVAFRFRQGFDTWERESFF